MARVQRMPDALANQIAAGEVVERPASVVKELVENAIDAGATSIKILIEKSGKERIRVSDNGIGMSPEDARLALERHATSKLFAAEDLANIASLGFRGEALPSIASVSLFTLRSREPDAEAGIELVVEGGKLVRDAEIGLPAGTIIDVERLFVNVPARRKFLRADATESSHIAAEVQALCACYPDIHFRLEHGPRTVLDMPSVVSRRERLYQLEGGFVETAVVLEEDLGALALAAWLAPPAEGRGSAKRLHFYVNGRPIKDRILHHAVTDAYRQVSSRSGIPTVYLFVDLPPDKVDVNVHPGKSEVRFADQRFVHQAVFSAVKNGLSGQGRAPEATMVSSSPGSAFGSGSGAGSASESGAAGVPPSPRSGVEAERRGGGLETARMLFEGTSVAESTPAFAALAELPPSPLAQFRSSYILAADAESVWLVDQHAAHERILFDALMKRGEETPKAAEKQLLLEPRTLDLTPSERVTIEEELESFLSFGYDIEPFGGNEYVLRAVPASLAALDPIRLIREALSERERECRAATMKDAESRIAARIACHAAVKVNFPLGREKMQYLLENLWKAREPSVCPHGRPTSLRIGKEQIERNFGRL